MPEVPVRVLNQDTAGVLARVKSGEEIAITDRGVVVARLIPAQPSPLADLIASGKLHPRTAEGPMPRPTGPIRVDDEAGELLRAMRDDERY
jgi:prevent-host-death family protein